MSNPNKLPLYLASFKLQKYLYLLVRNFPKEYKYTLGQSILELGWKLLDAVITANNVPNQDKSIKILQISEHFDRLNNRLRMAYELKLISHTSYSHIIATQEETGRMISGWLNWAQKSEMPKA